MVRDTQSLRLPGHPRALDFPRRPGAHLQPAAPGRLAVEPSDHEETGVAARGEFRELSHRAPLRHRTVGCFEPHGHRARTQQPFDLGHGPHQAIAPGRIERL